MRAFSSVFNKSLPDNFALFTLRTMRQRGPARGGVEILTNVFAYFWLAGVMPHQRKPFSWASYSCAFSLTSFFISACFPYLFVLDSLCNTAHERSGEERAPIPSRPQRLCTRFACSLTHTRIIFPPNHHHHPTHPPTAFCALSNIHTAPDATTASVYLLFFCCCRQQLPPFLFRFGLHFRRLPRLSSLCCGFRLFQPQCSTCIAFYWVLGRPSPRPSPRSASRWGSLRIPHRPVGGAPSVSVASA